ncbi:MAG: acetylxylan esterase [Chloroflexi bacterium]|nr:acetylxylan esterase [Chloroflexota bacterium]
MTANPSYRPQASTEYWQGLVASVDALDLTAEVEHMEIRDTGYATMYGVTLTSLDGYKIFGYLSIPNGNGPFPARYYPSLYGSVVQPILTGWTNRMREKYVTFSLASRGQRKADVPFAADFPDLLTTGIESPDTFVYRGIIGDCYLGLRYLLVHPSVDTSKVIVHGNDAALITTSFSPTVKGLVVQPQLFYRTMELAPKTLSYPLEEINDYLRAHPGKTEKIANTLSFFDLRNFAPNVQAPTLLHAGPTGSLFGPERLGELAEAMPGKVEVFAAENSDYKDGVHIENWIAQASGVGEPILPRAWQTPPI